MQIAPIHVLVPQTEDFAMIPIVCGKHRAWIFRFLKSNHEGPFEIFGPLVAVILRNDCWWQPIEIPDHSERLSFITCQSWLSMKNAL
jgi:hypothetical protein